MAVAIITGEKELIPEGRIFVNENSQYPLANLGDRRFERFVYWIYKSEIDNGIWKDDFDEIRLMSGVRDGGKDCVLLKNNIQSGVIQCKFSENNKAFEAPVFAKELIKFGLYSLVETQAIRLYDGYLYYIVVSGQFHTKTLELVDNFPDALIEHKDFEKWTNEVIKGNASLKNFKFGLIAAKLKANLSKLTIRKIDGDDLQIRLESANQAHVRKGFFTIKSVVENEALTPIAKALTLIEGKLDVVDETIRQILDAVNPLPVRKEFTFVEGYLDRSVTGEDKEFVFSYFEEKKSLREVIRTKRKIALLGSGLIGKTTELKQLAHVLSIAEEEYFVYLIALDVYTNDSISSYIKGIDRIPVDKLVVLLDGLDQIPPDFETVGKTKIKAFVREYPDCRMVVSSRTNFYYTDDEDGSLSTLPNFESYTLQRLSNDDLDDLLTKMLGQERDDFWKCIRKYGLEELLTIPFYFNRFANQFKLEKSIAESKAELFEKILTDGIRADLHLLQIPDAMQRETDVYNALKKVALVMQMMGNYFFTKADIEQIVADKELVFLFSNMASIIYGSDHAKGNWSFLHSNFQEYLAARELSDLNFEAIKRTVSIKPAHNILKPAFLSTTSFLLSMITSQSPLKKENLVQWLEKDNPEQLIMIDAGTLDAGYRLQVFKKTYEEHKKQDIPFHHSKFNLSSVARFVESTLFLNFFISELNTLTIETAKQNLLKIALNIDIAGYPTVRAAFKMALGRQINGTDDYTRQLAINVNSTLFQLPFPEFDEIFKAYSVSEESGVRSALYFSLFKQGYQEMYIDFIMNQLEVIAREDAPVVGQKQKQSKRYFDERQWLGRCLLKIQTKAGILEYLDWMLKFAHRKFFPSQLKESFPKLLMLAEQFKDADLDERVKEIYLKTGPYYVQDHHEFIGYFNARGLAFDVAKEVYAMRTPPRYTELQIIATLADEQTIDFLIERYRDGSLQKRDMELFQDVLKDDQLELKIYFNMQMNEHMDFPFRVIPDHARKEFERESKLITIFFDKALFIAEVARPMKKIGRDVCFYNDLQPLRTQNHSSHYCFDFAFEVLRQPDDYYQIELDKVIAEIQATWPLMSMRWIYDFYKRHPKWTFSTAQLATITAWCTGQAATVDFYTASTRQDNRTDVPAAMLLAYFTRKLSLTIFPRQFYLDMLFYPEWEESAAQLEFIESLCGTTEVIAQMADNLAERKIPGGVFDRHLKYILKHKVKDLANPLFEYLKNENTYDWNELLNGFIALDGDRKMLWELLPLLSTAYYHDAVIEELIKSEPEAVKKYLLTVFAAKDEPRKLEVAKLLIRLQSREGFKYYYELLKHTSVIRTIPHLSTPCTRSDLFTWSTSP